MAGAFSYDHDLLRCEEASLEGIAAAHGTPTYVYSRASLVGSFRAIDRAFADVPHTICVALKANGNLGVGRVFAGLGAGADIVSGGELYRALRMGIPAEKIVFAGVGKTEAEIEQALVSGILMLNVESAGELETIARVAASLGVKAPIAIRVNPDVDPRTHPYITTGMRKYKFGIPGPEALRLYARASESPSLEPVGIQCHIGSQLVKVGPIVEAVEKLLALGERAREQGVPLRYLDIGGGLGIAYGGEQPEGPDAVARAIVPAIKAAGYTLLLEPGRFLVGNAGVLLTRVLYVKDNGTKKFAIVDAAMNDLIRPSLYDAYHGIQPVRPRGGEPEMMDVVGGICESGDFFAHDRQLPRVEPGDLLAIMSAGAYGFAMASNYNARPRAAEMLVDGATVRLVRRRETYEDLVLAEEAL